jgi:hypothetical protein
LAGLQVAAPQAVPGETVGDFAAGTARRAMEIAGAEHIGVIYRGQTAREVADWVTTPFPAAAGAPPPAGDARFLGLLLVLVAGVVATRPLLVGGPPPVAPRARATATIGWFVLAAAAGGLVGLLLEGPAERVPVAVAGYLLVWFGAGAVVLALAAGRRCVGGGTRRGLLLGTAAGAVLAACFALPARLTWAAYALPGQRWLVLVLLLVVLGAWFWGEARLVEQERGWRRAGLLAVSRVVVVAGLLGAVLVLGAPGFLTLTVPLMVPIVAVLGVVAWWARDPLAAAAAQAIPLALTVATTFPLLA